MYGTWGSLHEIFFVCNDVMVSLCCQFSALRGDGLFARGRGSNLLAYFPVRFLGNGTALFVSLEISTFLVLYSTRFELCDPDFCVWCRC